MPIFKFNPIYKSKIWGGNKIAKFKGIDINYENIGESWEISGLKDEETIVAEGPHKGATLSQLIKNFGLNLIGEKAYRQNPTEFPLLLKFIDATQDLSIQVHPNDQIARERHGGRGKTELWYILEAENDAKILSGFKRKLTPERIKEAIISGSITEEIDTLNSKPEDIYYLPAGQIHAIGAGNLLIEVQQPSDITYRIHDYDRKDKNGNFRELHIQEALTAINLNINNKVYKAEPNVQHDFDIFKLTKYNVTENTEIKFYENSFHILICVSGRGSIITPDICVTNDHIANGHNGQTVTFKQGETLLISADISEIRIIAESSPAGLLSITV